MSDFDELYLKYEKSTIPRIEIDAQDLFSALFIERIETGRIYIMNIDEANQNSPWLDQVSMTNLCVEILTPTIAQKFMNDPDAEIGICTIGAINMLNIKDDADHEECCYLKVRSLDNLIDLQEYSIQASENFAKNKRSLGIGITNLSAWLASKGLNQNSPEAPQTISDFMEKQQYYLLKASCRLAKERGPAPHYDKSKYSLGLMPTDMYNKNVDEILIPSKLDWGQLKEDIAKYGLRNMTVSAIMPAESSSVIQGSTNGVEPITSLVTKKTSTTETTIVIAPNAKKWKKHYLKKSDIKNDNTGLINCAAAYCKWLCMAASFNSYQDSSQFEDGNLPLSLVIRDYLRATKFGIKTFYYLNSPKKKDSSAELKEEETLDCVGGCML